MRSAGRDRATRTFIAASIAAVVFASGARAVPLPFTATLRLEVGHLATVLATGSGIGTSARNGGAATIPAGTFSLGATRPLATPLFGLVVAFALAGPGQANMKAPYAAGANRTLTFDGSTGEMGVDASGYLLHNGNRAVGFFPFPLFLGMDATHTMDGLGIPFSGTHFGQGLQLGMQTVAGELVRMFTVAGQPVPSPVVTLAGTGFDLRTGGGGGRLQLVSPNMMHLGQLGTMPVLMTVSIEFVPEPATAVLLGSALAALAAVRRGAR